MSKEERKALNHIIKHGDDLAMQTKKWEPIKIELWRKGLLKRRIGDWAWVAK